MMTEYDELAVLRERVRTQGESTEQDESLTAAIIRQAVLDLLPTTAQRERLDPADHASARVFLIDTGLLPVLLRRQADWPTQDAKPDAIKLVEDFTHRPVQALLALELVAA